MDCWKFDIVVIVATTVVCFPFEFGVVMTLTCVRDAERAVAKSVLRAVRTDGIKEYVLSEADPIVTV